MYRIIFDIVGVCDIDIKLFFYKLSPFVDRIVYGISDFSLAQDIGVTRKEAAEYIKAYFEKYRGIDDYLTAAVEAAKTLEGNG